MYKLSNFVQSFSKVFMGIRQCFVHPQVSLTECSFQLNWICLDLGAFYRGFEKGLARRGEVSKNVVWFSNSLSGNIASKLTLLWVKVLHWSYSLFKVESALWKSLCFGWKFCCMVKFGLGLRVFLETRIFCKLKLDLQLSLWSKVEIENFSWKIFWKEKIAVCKIGIEG